MKILVVGCDAYAHLAPRFMRYFRKAWPDCPYPVEFVADTKPLDVDTPVVYTERDTLDYGGKLKDYLEQCDDPLILIMMIDFLTAYVDGDMVQQAVDLIEEDDKIGRVQLSRPSNAVYTGQVHKSNRAFRVQPCEDLYALSTHVGIWQRDLLVAFVKEGETPWKTEVQGTNRMHKENCKDKIILHSHIPAIYVVNTYRFGESVVDHRDLDLEKKITKTQKKAEKHREL